MNSVNFSYALQFAASRMAVLRAAAQANPLACVVACVALVIFSTVAYLFSRLKASESKVQDLSKKLENFESRMNEADKDWANFKPEINDEIGRIDSNTEKAFLVQNRIIDILKRINKQQGLEDIEEQVDDLNETTPVSSPTKVKRSLLPAFEEEWSS